MVYAFRPEISLICAPIDPWPVARPAYHCNCTESSRISLKLLSLRPGGTVWVLLCSHLAGCSAGPWRTLGKTFVLSEASLHISAALDCPVAAHKAHWELSMQSKKSFFAKVSREDRSVCQGSTHGLLVSLCGCVTSALPFSGSPEILPAMYFSWWNDKPTHICQ